MAPKKQCADKHLREITRPDGFRFILPYKNPWFLLPHVRCPTISSPGQVQGNQITDTVMPPPPAAQERLFGVLDAIEMTQIPHRPDAPILVDDADDFGIEIVVLEAVPDPEIASREAAVPWQSVASTMMIRTAISTPNASISGLISQPWRLWQFPHCEVRRVL